MKFHSALVNSSLVRLEALEALADKLRIRPGKLRKDSMVAIFHVLFHGHILLNISPIKLNVYDVNFDPSHVKSDCLYHLILSPLHV